MSERLRRPAGSQAKENERGPVSGWRLWVPLGIRAVVAGVCAAMFVGGFSSPFQQVLVGLSVLLGMVAGEWAGRSSIRIWALLAGMIALATLGRTGGWFVTATPALAYSFGPASSLGVAGFLRLSVPAFALAFGLRAASVRQAWVAVLELAIMAAAVGALFAGHRDGVLVRPLWLSDWAYDAGVSPQSVLLGVGGVLSVALASLMVLERRRRVSWASVLALPALAAILWSALSITGLPDRTTDIDLGLTEHTDSDEWNQQDEGQPNQGGGDGDENEDGDEANGGPGGEAESENGGEAGGDEASEANAGDGASSPAENSQGGDGGGDSDQEQESDGGTPPPPPPEPPDFDSRPPNPQNPSPMAVVVLGDDYEPPLQTWYFRQESWSDYNGQRLVPSPAGFDGDGLDRFPVMRTNVREPPPTAGRQLVRYTVAMLVDHTRPLALDSPTTFIPAVNPDPERFVRAYNVESWAPIDDLVAYVGKSVGDPEWTGTERESYLDGPDDPRFRALAQEIIQTLPLERRATPVLQVLAIKLWLDENLIYSTQHQNTSGRTATADFLFGDRTGYCVHFAHASVFLMRSLGIPSRVASGYMVPADNRRGSNILLTSSDAHAWPEIWVDGIGWVIVDIHPQQVLDEPVPPPDEELTIELGEMARQQPDAGKPTTPDTVQRPNLWAWLWWQMRALVLMAVAGLYLTKLWRRLAPRFASPSKQAHVAMRSALDTLVDVGAVRRYGETRMAFAARMSDVPALATLTRMHEQSRYAVAETWQSNALNPVPSAADKAQWLGLLASVRAQSGSLRPWWWRVAGAMNPISFFSSR
jgi:transglutaminase-like putative cysteine protease